jgi:hypothetical protein
VDVKGNYNALLGRDWIHVNGCVPSMLHQCIIQWVGDEIEIVGTDDTVSVALAEACEGWQEGELHCLSGRNLTDFDYVSMGKEGFVPVTVKPMITTRVGNGGELCQAEKKV